MTHLASPQKMASKTQVLRATVHPNPGLPAEACLCGLNVLGGDPEKLPQVVI